MAAKRITARKYGGDDAYSWAVFIDGRPFVTGLSRREIPFYKGEAQITLDLRATLAASRTPATEQQSEI